MTKKAMHRIHLYFTFVSGLFILLIAISGVIYVFSDEIIASSHEKAVYVSPSIKEKQNVDTLLQSIEEKDYTPVQFVYKDASDQSFYILVKDKEDKFVQLYLNPYTSEIIHKSNLYLFFHFVESFHTELCMGAPGRAFIGIIAILFLLLILTGIFLWYPKKWSRKTALSSLVLKLKGNTLAINYNLHKILGFYIVIPSILLSSTGIIMAFDPIEMGLLKMKNADDAYESHIENIESESVSGNTSVVSCDQIIQSVLRETHGIRDIRVTISETKNSRYIQLETGNYFGMKYADNYCLYFIDKTNANALDLTQPTAHSLYFKKIISDLHTGRTGGLSYKIVLFLCGLIVFFLPLSGLYISYKKRVGIRRKKRFVS